MVWCGVVIVRERGESFITFSFAIPIAVKTATITSPELAKAKPTAVPRKGAVQGVASATASVPSKKLRDGGAVPRDGPRSGPVGWSVISKAPKRFIAKTTRTVEIAARKIGFWSWKPQPTAEPAARRAITTPARAHIEAATPPR